MMVILMTCNLEDSPPVMFIQMVVILMMVILVICHPNKIGMSQNILPDDGIISLGDPHSFLFPFLKGTYCVLTV